MKRIAFAAIGILLLGQTAAAEPTWSSIGFSTTASKAPQVVAAADKFMSSEVGKTFPGKLLLQVNTADGDDPATHTWVPIYKTVAEREAFIQSVQGKPAWNEFLGVMEKVSQPTSTVFYRTLKSWGDINDTDHVWAAYSFNVSDPAKLLAAVDALMASPTGQKFPGQVYLSQVVVGGISPVSHAISVGWASEAEMEAWRAVRDPSPDWAAYQAASGPVAEFLGGTLARDIKSWGPATLKDLTAP